MLRIHPVSIVLTLIVAACAGGEHSNSIETPIERAEPSPSAIQLEPQIPTPVSTESLTPSATTSPSATPVPSCIEQLPLRLALAQLVLPLASPPEFQLVAELAAVQEASGVVVLGSPTSEQIYSLPHVDGGGVPFWISADEEGGRVQRLRRILGPLPAASSLVEIPTDEVMELYRMYGSSMRDLGISIALAPVVDVSGGPGITDRSFSDDPQVVIEYGQAVISGYISAGIIPVLKHFPGHGRGSTDSHLGLSVTPRLEELRASDLLPFEALVSSDVAVMVGHLVVPGFTNGLPASLSPEAIDGLLRMELGFDGLVITDALNMQAITDQWGSGEAAWRSLVAGADMIIVGPLSEVPKVLDDLEASVVSGLLTRAQIHDSVERVFLAKSINPCDVLVP